MRTRSTSVRLLGYLRPYRGRLIVTAFLMVCFALFSGITIGLISPFVKVLFTPRAASVAAPARVADPAAVGNPTENQSCSPVGTMTPLNVVVAPTPMAPRSVSPAQALP